MKSPPASSSGISPNICTNLSPKGIPLTVGSASDSPLSKNIQTSLDFQNSHTTPTQPFKSNGHGDDSLLSPSSIHSDSTESLNPTIQILKKYMILFESNGRRILELEERIRRYEYSGSFIEQTAIRLQTIENQIDTQLSQVAGDHDAFIAWKTKMEEENNKRKSREKWYQVGITVLLSYILGQATGLFQWISKFIQ